MEVEVVSSCIHFLSGHLGLNHSPPAAPLDLFACVGGVWGPLGLMSPEAGQEALGSQTAPPLMTFAGFLVLFCSRGTQLSSDPRPISRFI